jgi:tRNA-specific 2-thiouridylase
MLAAGLDPKKDQSYFLYTLGHDTLKQVQFPIGAMTKPQVREYAHRIGLPNADRADSQGVCFIGDLNVRTFLRSRIHDEPGISQTTSGQFIGRHTGLSPYTIGQRHGFGIGGGTPYFVVHKDLKDNVLVVGEHNDPQLYGSTIQASSPIFNDAVGETFRCTAQIRYRTPRVPATIIQNNSSSLTVHFDDPQRAPAPGQAIVFYRDDLVLGGATIDSISVKNFSTSPVPA